MKVGVLIIGSLRWEDGTDGIRKKWREERLIVGKEVKVQVPICYGRKSSSRGDTYTMVFSSQDSPLGTALLVPCKYEIESKESLVEEAEALWKAESPSPSRSKIGGNSSDPWGCVGIMFREKGNDFGWSAHFRAVGQSPVEPVVTADGILNFEIPWLKANGDSSYQPDVILAIANKPESPLPTPKTIATAWITNRKDEPGKDYENYFFRDVEHGIQTPDDDEIWKIIKSEKPKWLANNEYKKAIKILEGKN
jgi:hypothetical protein